MNIKAEIIAHSINQQGDELISVLCTFPRIILAEVNTHRMLSKNTSSSRAIPFNKMVEAVQTNPFIPIAWQKDHKGMQGNEYLVGFEAEVAERNWIIARDKAVMMATHMNEGDITKQLCNRLLEPFMWTTMLITGPKEGWDNFFNLRCPSYTMGTSDGFYKSKKDLLKSYPADDSLLRDTLYWLSINKGQAEIHMMSLAEAIWDARNESTPKQLQPGEWHIPFQKAIVNSNNWIDFCEKVRPEKEFGDDWENVQDLAIKSSVAMAARTSYTVVGEEKGLDYETLIGLHDRLITQQPPHSSPMEHCCRAMSDEEWSSFIKGQFKITHSEPEYEELGEFFNSAKGWCNNIKGFIPYRYFLDNNLTL
jgi:thymidylate synthase ThyX